MRQALNIIAIFVAIVTGHGCGTAVSEHDATAGLSGSAAYYLSPGDKLKIKVFDEPDLSGDFQIDEQGKIAFPLVGEIQAGGLTLDQFRRSLIEQLQNGYVRTPRITADILNYRPVNIIGEVKNAGQYQYRPGISAQDAAAIAGGYTYRADKDTVYVIRGRQGKPITVDLEDRNFEILPGDTVKVPERFF